MSVCLTQFASLSLTQAFLVSFMADGIFSSIFRGLHPFFATKKAFSIVVNKVWRKMEKGFSYVHTIKVRTTMENAKWFETMENGSKHFFM